MPGMKTLEAMRFVQFKDEDTRHDSSYRRTVERRCIKLKKQRFNYVIPSGGDRCSTVSLPVTVTTHGSLSASSCSALTEPTELTELERSITKAITRSTRKSSIRNAVAGTLKRSSRSSTSSSNPIDVTVNLNIKHTSHKLQTETTVGSNRSTEIT